MDLINFEGQFIRKAIYNGELYFSVLDVIQVLSESHNVTDYFKKLRKRDAPLKEFVGTNCPHVEMVGKEGKKRKTIAANMEGVFRIIMGITSPKAEPFKLWLAEQGKRTLEEINDPELMAERQAEYYRLKGYSDEWIKQRMQTVKTRKELTDEWQKRGVQKDKEFSILTATIAKGTFGLTPSEHAQHKGLEKENLRDNMTDLELIFTALGEELTRRYTIVQEAQGFHENHDAAVKGGQVAGESLKNAEDKLGIKVVSKENFKHLKSGEADKLLDSENTPE